MGAGSANNVKVKEPELLSARVLDNPVTENIPDSARSPAPKTKKPNAAYQRKLEQIAERKQRAHEFVYYAKAHVDGTVELEAPKEGKYFHKVEKPKVAANFVFSDGTKQWSTPKSNIIDEDITSDEEKKSWVVKTDGSKDVICKSESSMASKTDVSLPIEFDYRVVQAALRYNYPSRHVTQVFAQNSSCSLLSKQNCGSQDFFKQDIKVIGPHRLVDQYNDTFDDDV